MWKDEEVVADLKVRYRNSPGKTAKNHEKPNSGTKVGCFTAALT